MKQSTPISELLGGQPADQVNQEQSFGQLPAVQQESLKQVAGPPPAGPSQGLSMPDRKEFFNKFDWKTAVIVFAVILIVSSGLFANFTKSYVPGSSGSDGKINIVGSLIAAIVGTILFMVIKYIGKV